MDLKIGFRGIEPLRYLVDVEFHKDYVRVDGVLIKVGLTSIPEKGKANMELIKKISKEL